MKLARERVRERERESSRKSSSLSLVTVTPQDWYRRVCSVAHSNSAKELEIKDSLKYS